MANGGKSAAGGAASLGAMWPLAVLVALMAAVEAAIWLGGAVMTRPGGLRGLALEYLAFWPGLLGTWRPNYAAQPWAMFLTYGFLHGGLAHFAVNMVTLWSLGVWVIERVGAGRFAVIYALSLLGGAAAFALLAADLRPMVGASGALFGLAGAVLAWETRDRFEGAVSLWPVVRAVGLLAGLNLVLWWAMDGLLAWQTHLGGFVAGWASALAVERRR